MSGRRFGMSAVFLILGVFSLVNALAADMEVPQAMAVARVKTSIVPSERIPGVKWEVTSLPVIRKDAPGKPVYYVRLPGENIAGYSVIRYIVQGKRYELIVKDKSTFELPIPINDGQTRVDVTAIALNGKFWQEVVYLNSNFAQVESPFFVEVGLAGSYLDYVEDFGPDHFAIKEFGVTGKLALSYHLSSKVEFGLGGFFTLVPLAISKSPSDISPSRFYGINGRVGYRLTRLSERSDLYLMAGYYIWGQMVPDVIGPNSYGVTALGGPQLFLSARFKAKNGRPYFVYAKFAAIQDGQKFLVSNNEIAAGAGYQITDVLEPRHWVLTFDVTRAGYHGNKLGLDQSFRLLSATLGLSTNL